MSAQQLTAFEKNIVAALSARAGLAAAVLDVWSELPENSAQSERSLIDLAQLGVTEERATKELLEKAVELGLLDATPLGFCPRGEAHSFFKRLAFALNAVEHYVRFVHRDATIAGVVLTKPATPSILEQRLSDIGWRTADLEPTAHAFHSMVRSAQTRVVVMTPFLDMRGALWLKELFMFVRADVERILVLRSLEDVTRNDYPVGFDVIAPWLTEQGVKVFNYSIPRTETSGRETFHAKVVLCDRHASYVGSSNMNSASIEHSMEMGIVVQGKAARDVSTVIDCVLRAAAAWR